MSTTARIATHPTGVETSSALSNSPGPVVRSLTLDFLAWIDRSPRTYADVLATWPTSCPRLSIWEDALEGGLVTAERRASEIEVRLTDKGRATLDGAR